MNIPDIAALALSYLICCFSTGYYLVRLRTGQDIRELGSGSAGGRNVSRFLGTRGLALTGLGDILKGSLAVWLAITVGASQWAIAGSVAAVVSGHIWPVQLAFRGGKGLATAFGALLVYDYRFVLIWIVIGLAIWIPSRRATLSGIVAIALTPFASLFLCLETERMILIFVLSGIMLVAFRDNIRRIISERQGN